MAQPAKWVGGRWQSGFKREIALVLEGRIDRRIIGSGQVQERDTVPVASALTSSAIARLPPWVASSLGGKGARKRRRSGRAVVTPRRSE